MRLECINVRARSANEGSGTADWPLVAPLACFPKDEEALLSLSWCATFLTSLLLRPNAPS